MIKKLVAGISIVGITVGVMGGLPATAVSQPIDYDPFGGVEWSDPNSNFAVGVKKACNTSDPGFSFRENGSNSFDAGGSVTVNGTSIGAIDTFFDLTTEGFDALARYPETGTMTAGDLGVSVSYRITSDDIVRTMVTITNNGASDATDVAINIENDFGDPFTIGHVDAGTWRPSGRWFVTTYGSYGENDYGPIFHLPDGPGSPESPATYALCTGTPLNLESGEFEDSVFGYLVDIPVGETRRIIIIQGVDVGAESLQSIIDKAESYDPAAQTPGSGILSDLSDIDACTVVNWAFDVCGGGGDRSRSPFIEFSLDPYQEAAAADLPDTL